MTYGDAMSNSREPLRVWRGRTASQRWQWAIIVVVLSVLAIVFAH